MKWVATVLGSLLALSVPTSTWAQFGLEVPTPAEEEGEDRGSESSDLHSLYYSAHLPTDRRLAQDLEQADQLFQTGRFSEGLPLVDRVLAASEDTFQLAHQRESHSVATSLKLEARRLLTKLSPAGVAALELDQGVKARRALDVATASGSLEALASIAERYPVTEAATEALLLLAQAELDSGDYASAAAIYNELGTWPRAQAEHGALLAVRLVMCSAAAGNHGELQEATERLKKLSSPSVRAEVQRLIGNSSIQQWLTSAEQDAKAPEGTLPIDAWLMEGRTASRNPQYPEGGMPHVWPAWDARTVKDYQLASKLESRVDWQNRHGVAWGLVSSPVAVGNYLIARTPSNLVAIDFESGRRVWETRNESLASDDNTISLPYEQSNQQNAVSLGAVEQRMWVDAVYGALSSDGDRVYAIRNLDSVQLRANVNFRVRILGQMGEEIEEAGNTLTAYDLRTEGKRLWEITGENNPQLAGCFFLGAPIAVDGSLYVLAEFSNAIHLVQLNPETGALEWKQPLANLERSVMFDVGRRLAGASPTSSNGLILCPTGAGSVVAVNPTNRSLAWAFRYEVDESLASRANLGVQYGGFGAYQPALMDRWQRNRVIAVGSSLLVTSPECEQLYCLDATTGAKRWSYDRGDHDYLAGATEDQVVLVASRHLTLLDLETGKPVEGQSQIDLPEGTTVAGLGVLAGNSLMLPLSGNRIAAVDLAERKFQQVVALREGQSVGNLVYHRGALVSQSPTSLTRLDELATLQERLAKLEAAGTKTAESLRIKGELAWGDGDLDRAIELLLDAYRQSPDDAMVRLRLNTALVAALRQDYARYQPHANLLAELATDTPQRLELFRFYVDGSLGNERAQDAYDYLKEIYVLDGERLVTVNAEHEAQPERWFAARLAQAWQRADASLRESITADVERMRSEIMNKPGQSDLSRFVRYFGGIPAGENARLALAQQWAQAGRLAEAELLLLQSLGNGADKSTAPSWADVVAMLPAISTNGDLEANLAATATWPDGRVETDLDMDRGTSPGPNMGSMNMRMRSRGNSRLLLEPRFCGVPWAGPSTLTLAFGAPNQLVGWNSRGEVTHGIQLQFGAMQNVNPNLNMKCLRFGHFVVLSMGTQVAVVDLRAGQTEQGPMLWASTPDFNNGSQRLRAVQIGGRTVIQAVTNSGAESEGPAGELCAAAPLGVVLRTGDLLKCYDPVDGDILWQRRGMPVSGNAFGDADHLFLIADGEAEGVVLSMLDGSTIGKWRNPEGKMLMQCGRNVVVTLFQAGKRVIRIIDPLNGKVLVERGYAGPTKYTTLAPSLVAAMEPDGKFEVLDAQTGEVRFAQQLLPEQGLDSIYVSQSDNLLILATNTRSAAQHNTSGHQALDNAPIVTGHVYAIDAETGEPQWNQPATVAGQGFWLLQPTDSPVLAFVSRFEDRQTNRQTGYMRVLCLDKRTGRSLVREDRLRDVDSLPWVMRIDQSAIPTVTLDLRHTEITMRFTDTPRPPEPVTLEEVEGVTKSASAGLFGIFRRFSNGSLPAPAAPPLDVDD